MNEDIVVLRAELPRATTEEQVGDIYRRLRDVQDFAQLGSIVRIEPTAASDWRGRLARIRGLGNSCIDVEIGKPGNSFEPDPEASWSPTGIIGREWIIRP